MSDSYPRLVPTDPAWVSSASAARQAITALSLLAPEAEDVETVLYDEVTFIDPGGNLERVGCPACHEELEIRWWTDRMDEASRSRFVSLSVETPCCNAATNLNDLTYCWAAGFAHAELSVLNPGRRRLDDDELALVAVGLGHPIKQVMAHY